MVTVRFTPSEVEALGYALDLAYDDQSAYLDVGNPEQDYGAEWPEVSKRKAEQFHALAQIGFRIGLAGELERWNNLATAVLSVNNDDDDQPKEGEQGDTLPIICDVCKVHQGDQCQCREIPYQGEHGLESNKVEP